MAKNLKINVKNTQLAQALKLGQVKKPVARKKKEDAAEKAADESQHVSPASAEAAPASPRKVAPAAKKGAEIESPARSEEKETSQPPVREQKEAAESKFKPSETPSQPIEPTHSRPPVEKSGDLRSEQPQTPPRRESSYQPPQDRDQYPPRRDSYPPRTGGYPQQRPSNGYPQRSDSPGGYPQRSEGSGGYPPRTGGYPQRTGGYPQRSEGSGGYPPRTGGYPPRSSGPGGYPQRSEGSGGYPPRTGGYPPRTSGPGGYPPRTGGYPPRTGGYPPRTSGPGGYPPRTGGYPPRTGGPGGYPPRTGGYPPRDQQGTMPPKDFPRTEKGGKSPTEERKPAPQKDMREHKPTRKFEAATGFDARDRLGLRDQQDEQGWRKRRPAHKMRSVQQEEVIRPKNLKVRIPISVKDLASEMKLKASQLIAKLFMKGVVLTLNDFLDDETTIQLLGQDFDCEIAIDRAEENRLRITDRTIKQEIQEENPENLLYRPPVVAFMGHVDHGKTSLIDAIRKTNVAQDEAGAITQHIGAFKCHTDAGDITILDTPGHEAFSAMRARGADVTDIVVLVIAGDEGIRTQTVEAMEQAQAANVPIIVALNKSDKPNFNAENIYRQLADKNLLPEAWGGQTITVNCSAATGSGIKELLEMLALQAEVLELKANASMRARGTVIESQMHKGMGPVATVLVQNGTLNLGDALVFTQHYARVKTMQDEFGKDLLKAGPSTPVKITGMSGLPEAGSEFIVVKNEKEAMEIAEKRSEGKRHTQQLQTKRTGLEGLLSEKTGSIAKKTLTLILRADVQGSVEALKTSLQKILTQKVELNIISSAVGEISESDVQLAHASKATIIGFHTQVESHAESLIKELKVTVKLHDIIYHAVDDVRAIMTALLDKIPQESDTGTAEVKTIFKASQLGVIAGCMITDGTIKRSNHVRLMRDKQMIWKGPIASIKRGKEDVRDISKGYECGILLHNNNEIKAGDILQAFEITYLQQEL